jgi:hypothetical protein
MSQDRVDAEDLDTSLAAPVSRTLARDEVSLPLGLRLFRREE